MARSAGAAERDVADQVDDLAEPLLVEAGAGEVLRQHTLERGVVALDRGHRIVDQRADGRLRRARLQVLPARLLRHPEDAGGAILVRIFRIGALRLLGFKLGVLGLEGVGDVLEEDQAEDDVLVLRRVHVVAQRVGGGPELGFEAEVGAGVVGLGFLLCHQVSLLGGMVGVQQVDALLFAPLGREMANTGNADMPTGCVEQSVNGLAGVFLQLEHGRRLSSLLGLICKGLSHKHNKNTQSWKLRRDSS